MRPYLVAAVAAFSGIGGFANPEAYASPVVGEVSSAGSYSVDNPNLSLATKFLNLSGTISSSSGDFLSPSGLAIFETPFTFAPFPGAGVPGFWSEGPQSAISIDLVTCNIVFESPSALLLTGTGIAHVVGRDDTPGDWVLSANSVSHTFQFSVPEPTASMLLLTSLCGAFGRRSKGQFNSSLQ